MAYVFFTHIKEDILESLADISEGRLKISSLSWSIDLFKVSNWNDRATCKIFEKLVVNKPERCHNASLNI